MRLTALKLYRRMIIFNNEDILSRCTTRSQPKKMYNACVNCTYNICNRESNCYGTCKYGYDNFYIRKSKDNGCPMCASEIREMKK